MRLLGLTNLYPPLGYGYGAICADVMEELRSRGHSVRVLCAEGGAECALGHVPGAWRRPTAGLRAERQTRRAVRAALDQGVDAAIAWHMRGVPKRALTVLHDAGVPVLYMLGDLWVLYERPGPPSAWRWWSRLDGNPLYRTLRGLALRPPPITTEGHVVFASTWLRDRYAQDGFAPAHSEVIPNGLRLEDVTRAEPGPPRRLLFAGRADETKGADVAVAALRHLPEAQLTIAGEAGPELQRDERVELRGTLPRDQVLELLAHADVFVMPGRIEEAFGLVYLEAMAAGVPVVGSARGGAADLCRDGENCLVVAPEPKALAGRIAELEDAGLRDRLIAGGLRTAEAHSLDRMVDRVEALLATVTRS